MGWKSTKYTSTAAITAPASFFYVSGCAGGSGGGGGDPTPGGGGGGGCSGQPVDRFPICCVAGETLTLTVGAAGAGGAVSTNGGTGGDTLVSGSTSGVLLKLYAGTGGLKAVSTAGGNGGSWVGGSGLNGGSGGASGVAGGAGQTNALSGSSYQLPFASVIAKFSMGGGGGGLGANGGYALSAKNGWEGGSSHSTGGASGGGGGGGGCTPWGAGGTGGSNGAAGSAPAAGQYGAGGGGGSGNSAGGGGSPGVLWLIWFDDADVLNVLTSALTLAGSIGKLIADNLNATVSSRSTYDGSDTAGTTTLLARIIGTLATGTHNPQSGDAYARLGAPAGASVSADIATRLATSGYTAPDNAGITAIKAKTDNLPADTNTLLTSTGIKIASIANGAIAAATFAAGALDAVWSTATRTLTAISDSAGITTLLSRIIGTLASGTHQPQSGDAYARLGAPAGASVSADIATKASQASVNALADRLAEQVPTGPVMVLPAPETGQTVAYVRCLSSAGAAESEVIVHVQMVRTRAGATGYAYSGDALVGESNADGLAAITIPRAPGAIFRAWRGDGGRQVTFAGVDAETVAIPDLLGD